MPKSILARRRRGDQREPSEGLRNRSARPRPTGARRGSGEGFGCPRILPPDRKPPAGARCFEVGRKSLRRFSGNPKDNLADFSFREVAARLSRRRFRRKRSFREQSGRRILPSRFAREQRSRDGRGGSAVARGGRTHGAAVETIGHPRMPVSKLAACASGRWCGRTRTHRAETVRPFFTTGRGAELPPVLYDRERRGVAARSSR